MSYTLLQLLKELKIMCKLLLKILIHVYFIFINSEIMPNAERIHIDMLQLCCGICGKKKNPSYLRTITDNILTKIRFIKGYGEYDLGNDRYPKKICKSCYFPVHERFSNPFNTEFNYKLPDIPNFSNISLPYMPTRASPIGYNECHNCFLCEKIRLEDLKLNTKA